MFFVPIIKPGLQLQTHCPALPLDSGAGAQQTPPSFARAFELCQYGPPEGGRVREWRGGRAPSCLPAGPVSFISAMLFHQSFLWLVSSLVCYYCFFLVLPDYGTPLRESSSTRQCPRRFGSQLCSSLVGASRFPSLCSSSPT